MEVRHTTALQLNHFDEGRSRISRICTVVFEFSAELAAEADSEPTPELGSVPGKQNMAHVVVALAAQRLAHDGIVQVVDTTALVDSAVFALPVVSTPGVAGSASPGCVDSAEARGGERNEQLRVVGHGTGNTVMPAVQAGVDELPNVAGIQVRT
jgi:hypothetical protein